jgi:hypothetical protein
MGFHFGLAAFGGGFIGVDVFSSFPAMSSRSAFWATSRRAGSRSWLSTSVAFAASFQR